MAVAPVTLPPDLVARLEGVRSVGVVTGAGVSRGSGLPTWRGAGGLYEDPVSGARTVEALSGPTLRADPDRTWRAVAALARAAVAARPGPAHEAVVRIERAVERFVLLTQNVDGLHQAAGSREVIAIHGDVLAVRCLACGARGRLAPAEVRSLEAAPTCPACGGTLRPDAVLFGERLPPREVERLVRAFLVDPPDLVVAAGTSALFDHVAEPVRVAAAAGRLTVEVNPHTTVLSPVVRYVLRTPAETALPALAEAIEAAVARRRGR